MIQGLLEVIHMVNSANTDNKNSTREVTADSAVADEPAVRWVKGLFVVEFSKHSLILSNSESAEVRNPALFLTEQGQLYLRLSWGHYYMVTNKVDDTLLPHLRLRCSMELSLQGPDSKYCQGCRLYHIEQIPDLISEVVEPEKPERHAVPDFEEYLSLTGLRSSARKHNGRREFTPEDESDKEDGLTAAKLAEILELEQIYKVDSTHYLAYYEDNVYLFGIFDEKKNWQASEHAFLNSEPTWKSGAWQHISPVSMLRERQYEVEQRLGGNVHAVLVLGEGCNVENEAEMEEFWKQSGVHVCTIEPRIASDLPYFASLVEVLAYKVKLTVPVAESELAAAGYQVLVYSNDSEDDEDDDVEVRLTENLKNVLNLAEPIAVNGAFSLWYTPGHVYLVRTLTEMEDWLADEDWFNGEEPLWFSESTHMVSPIHKLGAMSERIEREYGITPHKLLLVPHEISIINSDKMEAEWNSLSVFVAAEDGYIVPDGMRSLQDCIFACRADDEHLALLSPDEQESLREWFEEL